MTRGYGFLEDKLKTYVQSRVARGKIDFYLSIETLEDTDVVVSVNHSLAAGYIAAFRELSERYHLPDTVTVNSLSRYPDIFSVHKAPEDEEAIWADVKQVAEKAVQKTFSVSIRPMCCPLKTLRMKLPSRAGGYAYASTRRRLPKRCVPKRPHMKTL